MKIVTPQKDNISILESSTENSSGRPKKSRSQSKNSSPDHLAYKLSSVPTQGRTNARLMKWMQMLGKGLSSDPETLIRRARKGIPASLRARIWTEFTKEGAADRMSYSIAQSRDSLDISQIRLDIPRTFVTEQQAILEKSLFEVLRTLSTEFPEIGYCQGMNFLTMRILQILPDDSAYRLISGLIRKHHQIYNNLRNPGFAKLQTETLASLIAKYLPKMNQRLEKFEIDPMLYSAAWFLTLFSKVLSEESFFRFMDCLLVEGFHVVYKMGLALLKLKEKAFMASNSEDSLILLSDCNLYKTYSPDYLISLMNSFQLDSNEILALENHHNSRLNSFWKTLEKTISDAYAKKRNQPQTIYLEWTLEDFDSISPSLITFEEDS